MLKAHSGRVMFGLRPEHVTASSRPLGTSHALQATLRFIEHMGSEAFVHFDLGTLPLTARVPADQMQGLEQLPRGAHFTAHLQLDRCHLFDADSGVNLLL